MELQSKSGAAVSVSEGVFGVPYNETLVHQVVTSYLAGARSGNSAQKNRAAVRGGGAKPWRERYWSCTCRDYSKPNLASRWCDIRLLKARLQ